MVARRTEAGPEPLSLAQGGQRELQGGGLCDGPCAVVVPLSSRVEFGVIGSGRVVKEAFDAA